MHRLKVSLNIMILLLMDWFVFKEFLLHFIIFESQIRKFKVKLVLLLLILLDEGLDFFILDVEEMLELINLIYEDVSLILMTLSS